MATINYNGMELEEVTTPQIFDPPKKMLVWNNIMDYAIQSMVVAIVERMDGLCAMCYDGEIYPHCSEIPDPPRPRRATNRELARWIAEGKGEILVPHCVTQHVSYPVGRDNAECVSGQQVRKWSDIEWHEPTVDYLFGGD